jgi:hypothetical protein
MEQKLRQASKSTFTISFNPLSGDPTLRFFGCNSFLGLFEKNLNLVNPCLYLTRARRKDKFCKSRSNVFLLLGTLFRLTLTLLTFVLENSGDAECSPELFSEAEDLSLTCYSNLAACQFQWGNHKHVIELATRYEDELIMRFDKNGTLISRKMEEKKLNS